MHSKCSHWRTLVILQTIAHTLLSSAQISFLLSQFTKVQDFYRWNSFRSFSMKIIGLEPFLTQLPSSLIYFGDNYSSSTPRSCRSSYTSDWPKSWYNMRSLDPSLIKDPLSTSISIFWSARNLCFHYSRIRNNLPYYCSWKREKGNFWSYRNNLCYYIYWAIRIYHLSSSYIYSRLRCRYTSIFYLSYYNHCNSNRH